MYNLLVLDVLLLWTTCDHTHAYWGWFEVNVSTVTAHLMPMVFDSKRAEVKEASKKPVDSWNAKMGSNISTEARRLIKEYVAIPAGCLELLK